MVLFICNTPYQLFNALRLKMTKFIDVEADIIISDHSTVNMFEENIIKESIFNNVYSIKSLALSRGFFHFENSKKRDALNKPYSFIKDILNINYLKYDNIFFANIEGYIQLIYRYIINEKKKKTIFSLYEDGWSSYTNDFSNYAISDFEKLYIENKEGKLLQKNIDEKWVYDIRLLCHPSPFGNFNIPKIDLKDKKYKELVNRIFNYSKSCLINENHLFLEEAFSQDGYKNNDLEIVKNILDYIPKNDFIVKRHPRLKKNRFEKNSIKTNSDQKIPFEVYILNQDFSKKLIYTITSSAVLTPSIVFDKTIKVMYLKKLLKGKVSKTYTNPKVIEFIDKYKSIYGSDYFYEPLSFGDIKKSIKSFFYSQQHDK